MDKGPLVGASSTVAHGSGLAVEQALSLLIDLLLYHIRSQQENGRVYIS